MGPIPLRSRRRSLGDRVQTSGSAVKKINWLIVASFLRLMSFSAPGPAIGPAAEDSARAFITVHSVIFGIAVYCDTTFLGGTLVDSMKIEPGMYIIRLVYPDSRVWLRPVIVETVLVHSGDLVYRLASFPIVYHISSEP